MGALRISKVKPWERSALWVLMKALSPGRRTAPGPERVKLDAWAVPPPVISSTPFSTVREELYRLSLSLIHIFPLAECLTGCNSGLFKANDIISRTVK